MLFVNQYMWVRQSVIATSVDVACRQHAESEGANTAISAWLAISGIGCTPVVKLHLYEPDIQMTTFIGAGSSVHAQPV